MKKKPFYIATAIAYTSGKPHIGNVYEIVLADAIARFMRLYGYDVYFQTGTDEHGQKIETNAAKAGMEPRAFVDKLSGELRQIWDMMNTSYDAFIRTTDPKHKKCVQRIFKKLYEQGDIYKGEYEGMYCAACESFYTESQLVEGKCPDCAGEVNYAKEEAYFFKISNYQERLAEFIETHPDFIQPESRKNEMLNNFIRPGLKDLCVSRTSFKWGIPVDFDENHVVYVWIDALSNYITFLDYNVDGAHGELFTKYWPCSLHLIGKDILRFHTIYWPIMLMALGVELPKAVFGHGWLLIGDGKMSKSKGNVIYADELVRDYGLDQVRYYLLREMPFAQDGTFTYELLVERINGELVNILGNLVNRTIAMARKYFDGAVPKRGQQTAEDKELIKLINLTPALVAQKMHQTRIADSIQLIFNLLRRSNKYIDETAPWILARDEAGKDRLGAVLYNLLEAIRVAAVLLGPFIPDTSEKMLNILNTKKTDYPSLQYGGLEEGVCLNDAEILFERIDSEAKLVAAANALKTENKASEPPQADSGQNDAKAEITIEDFAKVELKTGRIVEAKKHPDADKLLVFKVEVAGKIRQIVSGIAKYFPAEELIGKQVVVVTNLKTAKLRGVESQGMILLAEDGGGLSFVSPERDMESGSTVR